MPGPMPAPAAEPTRDLRSAAGTVAAEDAVTLALAKQGDRPGFVKTMLRIPDPGRAAIAIALCLALFVSDLVTSAGLNQAQLYAVAMLPLYRMRSKWLLWSVVSLAIVLSAAGYLLDPPADVWDGVIDRLFSVLVILTVAVGMSKVAQSERRLLLESMTDPLTGLLNRRRFTDLSNREEARSRRHGLPFSVLMIDIDHFKRINDEHGHPVGDQAIKALADICTGASRPHDILARYGGEEFVMTLPQTREDGARVVAERIRSRVEASSLATGTAMVRFTVSIGVSSYAKDMAFQQVIERADQALYEAKRGGRNRIVDLPPATGLAA